MADPKWAVQAPDGKVIQFPDNFTDSDVNREMSKMYAPQASSSTSGNFAVPSPGLGNKQEITSQQPTGPLALQRNTPLKSFQAQAQGRVADAQQQGLRGEISPMQAGLETFTGGSFSDLAGLAGQPMESVKNAALTAGTMIPGVRAALAPYFMYQGGKMALSPQQQQEPQADYLQRALLGGSMVAGGAAQTAEGIKGLVDPNSKEFSRVKQLSTTKEGIETNGAGLFHRVRDTIATHKAALEKQGADAIQQAIDTDNASQLIKGRGNISTSPAITAASDVITKTAYDMKPQERQAFNALAGKSELTLQEAKLLRTQFGRLAFGRASSPEFQSIGRAAYDELGEAMKGRLGEMYGPEQGNKLFDYYNNRFQMSFGLEQKGGVAEPFLSGIHNQDPSASIEPLKKFAQGNVSEITKQMRTSGNDLLAQTLERSQKDAKALTSAHDSVNGKFASGLYRMLMSHPRETWPGLAAFMAIHGVGGGFLPAMLGGVLTGAASLKRALMAPAAELGTRLRAEMPPEAFQTRTAAMPTETFTPKPEDEWTTSSTPTDAQRAERVKKISQARNRKAD